MKPDGKDKDKDKKDKDKKDKDKKDKDGKNGDDEVKAAPARLLVTLPADATLTVDGNATTSTSSRREFITPPLKPGKDFQYTLKATVQRDGKPVEMEKRVEVRAGKETQVTLTIPDSVAAR